ncbi:MAG: radical SAM protein, partial [Clostridia bacterium]|nr:radical SAM protein [Clostridia bacterium]
MDGNLYINLTNKCSNACDFCVRNERSSYYGNYLWLKNGDPTVEKVIAQANGFGDLTRFKEVVFCGFGEPTYKVAEMLALCDFFHDKGLKTRLNTNGQGNLINKRDIVPDLKDKIDFVNISLNASCYEKYQPICRSQFKEAGFESMIEFARLCRRNGVDCRFSIVDCIGEDEVAACKYLAESVKIPFKDIGIGMTLADYRGHWHKQTLLQKLIARQVHMEEVQEETRILYVALTRAKDFLYMTGTVRDGEKYREFLDQGITGEGTYLEMIGQTSNLEILNADRLSFAKKPVGRAKKRISDPGFFAGEPTAAQKAEVERRLSYVYPYEAARKLKSKYSVSELNQMEKPAVPGRAGQTTEPAMTLAVPKFRQGEKKLTAAEKGTIYHGIMERIDFGR